MSAIGKEQSTPPTFDFAIIGAGLAGSLCAHLLSQSGHTVCVIEKSRGSGGRASSRRLEGDTCCDLGAPYIHARHIQTQELFKTLNKAHVAAPWKQLSKVDAQAFVGTPEMSAITRHWLGNTHFITNTRIHHLDQLTQSSNEQANWLLRDDKYQPVAIAQKIIIAAPAPQAAAILASHSTLAILLLRANQASSQYQSQWAMWLETENCDLNALIELKNSPLQRMIKDNYKPMRHSEKVDRWVIHADPDWTEQHIDADKDWITQTLLQAFAEKTEHRVLKHGEPHRWFLSRFVENKGNKDFVWSTEHNVGLIGDWLCQGDAEGALLSALSLANYIKDAH